MKKKIKVLVAVCAFSMIALTACATDNDEDGTDIDVNPTTSVAPGNTTNGGTGTNDVNDNLTVTPNP